MESISHSSKILTIQQGITRGVSSVGKPCRPEHGFPRPNCPGNALIFTLHEFINLGFIFEKAAFLLLCSRLLISISRYYLLVTLYNRFHDGEPLCELGNEDAEATFDIGFDPIENVQSKWDKYLVSKLDLTFFQDQC